MTVLKSIFLLLLCTTLYSLEINIRKRPPLHAISPNEINQAQIETYQYTSSQQLLNHLPGVSAPQTNGLGEFTVWGNRPGHNLILIDGVPQFNGALPAGNLNLNDVTSDTVQSLKLDKGVTALMQPGSMGGLIQIETQRGNSVPTAALSTEWSHQGSSHQQLKWGQKFARSSHFVHVGQTKARPYSRYNSKHNQRLNSAYELDDMTTTHAYQPHKHYQAFAKYQRITSRLGVNKFNQSVPTIDDQYRKTVLHNFQLSQIFKSSDLSQTHSLNLAHCNDHQDYVHSLNNLQQENQLSFVSYRIHQSVTNTLQSFAEISQIKNQAHFSSSNYAQQQQSFGRLNVLWGQVKKSNLQLNCQQQFNQDNHTINPQAIATFKLSKTWIIKTSMGWGSRQATLYERHGHTAYHIKPNPTLKPEHTRIMESEIIYIPVSYQIQTGLRVFQMNYTQLITMNNDNDQYFNLYERSVKGVEASLSYKMHKLNHQFSYTFLNARNKNSTSESHIPYVPRHRLLYHGNYAINDNWAIFYEPTYTIKESNHYSNVKSNNHNYFTLRMGGSYKLNDQLSFKLRLENLTNSRHEMCYGYGYAPRTIYGGLKAEW